ncbi:MAG: cation:proton antiporter [Nanoarchaeota archaeon]|nr:cation:proton antiporter [Nanoarchaeota archaeon]
MQYLHHIAYIAIILLLGTLASVLAYTLKTSDIFILLLTGMICGRLGLLQFNEESIIVIGILALIFIMFNSATRFRFKELKKHIFSVIKLNITYFALCIVILTIAIMLIFGLEKSFNSLMISMLGATLMYGTDSTAMLSFFKKSKNKIIEIIEMESIINTTITVIVSFLLLTILSGSQFSLINNIPNPIISFLRSIIVALLIASFLGWIIISILKKNYFGKLTHLAVLTSAIISYVAAEYLGGSGVLSVAVFGLIFGNSHVSHFIEIEKFESILTNTIKILTFMLLGTIIFIKPEYVIKGTVIFIIYIIIRFISVVTALKKEKIKLKQIIFITLNAPKGIDIAVIVLLIISIYNNIPNIEIIINLTLLMILYTICLSSIVLQFSKYFLEHQKEPKNVTKVKRN